MANDTIGPNQSQGGFFAGPAPATDRYQQQVQPQGADNPTDQYANRRHVISAFGEGSAALASGVNTLADSVEKNEQRRTEAEQALWLTQASSADELQAQQMAIDAKNSAQPGQPISTGLSDSWTKYMTGKVATVTDPVLKAKYAEVLTNTGKSVVASAQQFDDKMRTDYALNNFGQAVENKAKFYRGLPYQAVDSRVESDLGQLNSTINNTVADPEVRMKMRTDMLAKITDAANMSKIENNPAQYLKDQTVAHTPAAQANSPVLPRGLRNNNPGNITGTDSWQGKTGADDGGYVQFDTPENGLRAMAMDLKNQQQVHGLNTVQDIISKYAPPSENNTPAYINNVSGDMGVKPDDKLDLKDPVTLGRMMSAMVKHENGAQPYSAKSIMWAASQATNPDLSGPAPPARADGGAMTSSTAFNMGTYEQQQHWMQEVHTKLIAQASLTRGDVNSRWENSVASVKATGSALNEPSPMEIAAAYPENPDQAQKMIETLQDAHTFNDVSKKIGMAPVGTESPFLDSLKPTAQDADFARKQRMYDVAAEAIKTKYEQLDKDPAGYVFAQLPDVQKSWQVAAKDPTAFDGYAATMNATYDKLGLPQDNRNLLPKYVSDSIVQQLRDSPPDKVRAKMAGLEGQFGDHWHDIMGELVKNKLPPEYMVLAAVDDPQVYANLSEGLQASKDGKDFKTAIGETNVKAIDQGLASHQGLMSLGASLAASGDNGATYASVMNAVRIAAYGLSRTMGTDAAVKAAAESVSNAKYSFGFDKTRLPPDLAMKTPGFAQAMIDQIKPTDLMKPANDQSGPASYAFFKNGYWTTTPNDDGIIRMDMYGFPVRKADGSRIQYSYDQIRNWKEPPVDQFYRERE